MTLKSPSLVHAKCGQLHLPSADVDDVTQEVVFRVWRNTGRLRVMDGDSLRAWISVIVRNMAGAAARHTRRARAIETEWPGVHRVDSFADPRIEDDDVELPRIEDRIRVSDPTPLEAAISRETRAIVNNLVSQVPPLQRDAVVKWILESTTLSEVARRQRVSRRTVSREARAPLDLVQKLLPRFEP